MPSSAEMIRRAVTPCHVLVTDFSFGLNFFLLYRVPCGRNWMEKAKMRVRLM